MDVNEEYLNWDVDGYPSHEELDDQKAVIEERNWDVLVVFDACRWDALSAILDEDIPKLRTPATSSTADWVTKIWDRDDDFWGDVTYISGNAMTDWVQNQEEFDHRYDCDLDGSVKEHVRAFNDGRVYDHILGAARPDEMTNRVIRGDYEPPIVVHYMQPHTPFIGNVSATAKATKSVKEWLPESKNQGIYALAEQGKIDKEVMRRAYLENTFLVWRHSKELAQRFDNVVYTADHGEVLGPDEWSHGAGHDPRARVVPWYEQ